MKYRYEGRGERVITAEDFKSLGVEHSDVYFNEDNECIQELSEEAAQALINVGEPLVAEAEPEDHSVEGGGTLPDEVTDEVTDEDKAVNVADQPPPSSGRKKKT